MQSLLDQKRWVLKPAPDLSLTRPKGVSDVVAGLILSRSNGEPECFLKRRPFYDPQLLSGVDRAVARLRQALKRDESVFIHGDFDVDGMTSTALMYKGLKRIGISRIKVEIEDRQRGHGLNDQVVQRLIREKFNLLVTTDCGISDVGPIEKLNRHGIDTIVTDHHQPPLTLPDAVALINPKLPGCPYPNKELAGVGVAFQLLRALYQALGRPEAEADQFLDLVMLGTVADLVPLVRDGEVENHELVRGGLERLARGQGNLGLRTLMEMLGLDPRQPSVGQISFVAAPHLNAANRVGDPRVALLLLTTQKPKLAEYLSEILIAYNQDRKRSQSALSEHVERAIDQGRIDLSSERLIWLNGQHWNPGILGLVASYVVDHYGLPVVLVSSDGVMSRASARSVSGFNMIECLQSCEDVFLRFGGHAMAAGFTIKTRKLSEARRRLLAYARSHHKAGVDIVHEIDTALKPEQINLQLHHELQQLAPFGVGNPTPKFLLPRVSLEALKTVGEGRHLKCMARVNGCAFETIGFSMGDYLESLMYFDEVGLVFKVGRNDWLGESKVQLELADVVEPIDV